MHSRIHTNFICIHSCSDLYIFVVNKTENKRKKEESKIVITTEAYMPRWSAEMQSRFGRFRDEQLLRSFRACKAVHRTKRQQIARYVKWKDKLAVYRDEFTSRGLPMPK